MECKYIVFLHMIVINKVADVMIHLHFDKWLAWISRCSAGFTQRSGYKKSSRKWVLPCDNSHRIALFSRLADWKCILCYLYSNLLVYPPICCVGFMIVATAVPSKICLSNERKYCGVLLDIIFCWSDGWMTNRGNYAD